MSGGASAPARAIRPEIQGLRAVAVLLVVPASPLVLAADAVDDAAADDTSWSSMRALARDIARQMDTAVR